MDASREIRRIRKPTGVGIMVTSDLVTSKEMGESPVNADDWCSCVEGALAKENHVDAARQTWFANVQVRDEKPYTEMEGNSVGRKIASLVVKATKE